MKILITGSSGHLGEGLMRTLQGSAHEVVGIDLKESQFTTHVGTIADREFVRRCMQGVEAVIHTATLHKPHIGTHSKQDFVDTNVTGTLNLLEEAVAAGVSTFIFTSTTSAFGKALQPPPGRRQLGLPRTCGRFPKTFMGRPSWRPRICANWCIASTSCRA